MSVSKQKVQPSSRRGGIDDEVKNNVNVEDSTTMGDILKDHGLFEASIRVMETVVQIEDLFGELKLNLDLTKHSEKAAKSLEAAIELISQLGDTDLLRRCYQVLIQIRQGHSVVSLEDLESEFEKTKEGLGFFTA
jgi:hypothetical protein